MTNENTGKMENFQQDSKRDILTYKRKESREMETKLAELTLEDLDWLNFDDFNETEIWVFGYGSLCWHPGFPFKNALIGSIRGFSRKFWQGNTTHRGTKKKPGRVATLIVEDEGVVWGQAFQLKEKETFAYLNNRECQLGGYITTITTFYPRHSHNMKPFPVIVYLATSSNDLWMGDTSVADIANEIIECSGSSGHNVEYLLRLAMFVREEIPEAVDDHLFTLESLVRSHIKDRNLCLKTLMGEEKDAKSVGTGGGEEEKEGEGAVRENRRNAQQFTATVPSKKLRCVNIC